jgi:hypothetical protein
VTGPSHLAGAPTPEASGEPRNWFYLLLNLASVLFVVTALAYAVVPVLEQKAADAGHPPPPSVLRDALHENGWLWLLWQAVAVVILALTSMGLDRYRRWRRERTPPSSNQSC